MGHDHHDHDHPHTHTSAGAGETPDWANPAVSDADLSPAGVSRRRFLQGLGVLGAAGAVSGSGLAALPAAAAQGPQVVNPVGDYADLVGDHHIHTKYSRDGMYEVAQQVAKADQYGVDWMVITDHGNATHQKLSIDKITPEIEAARSANGPLVFQGLEWNVPGAEHATVFVPPGPEAVSVLKGFEDFDGDVLTTKKLITASSENTPRAEGYAVQALQYLEAQIRSGRVPLGLMLANHPARRGLVSPHEFRGYRDATELNIAVGMEGAPGHQAAGIPVSKGGIGSGRGFYDNVPSVNSFPYPPNYYISYGGFDLFTAEVGGLWDSLLAEGKGWWITANSDNHTTHQDTYVVGQPASSYYAANGDRGTPRDTGTPQKYGDFWPGYYSKTHALATTRDYLAVMQAIQAGRMYVVHGDLVRNLALQVKGTGVGGPPVTFGGRTYVKRGSKVVVQLTVTPATAPNNNGDVPQVRKVDLIAGPVTGPVTDRDTYKAPGTQVVKTFEVSGSEPVTLEYKFEDVSEPFYLRFRGSDGNRLDPAGNPLIDVFGDADPWVDLWFYTNPVFVTLV